MGKILEAAGVTPQFLNCDTSVPSQLHYDPENCVLHYCGYDLGSEISLSKNRTVADYCINVEKPVSDIFPFPAFISVAPIDFLAGKQKAPGVYFGIKTGPESLLTTATVTLDSRSPLVYLFSEDCEEVVAAELSFNVTGTQIRLASQDNKPHPFPMEKIIDADGNIIWFSRSHGKGQLHMFSPLQNYDIRILNERRIKAEIAELWNKGIGVTREEYIKMIKADLDLQATLIERGYITVEVLKPYVVQNMSFPIPGEIDSKITPWSVMQKKMIDQPQAVSIWPELLDQLDIRTDWGHASESQMAMIDVLLTDETTPPTFA